MSLLGLLGLDKRIERYRELAAGLAQAAEDRVALFMIEWQEEKLRLRRMVVLGVLAAALAIVAGTVVSLAIMVQFWDTEWRRAAAWCVALAWIVAWVLVVGSLMRASKGGERAFALTRQELGRDWAEMKERS